MAGPETHFSPTRSVDFSVVAGKTALITGGASGIGLGIATALAENGAQVALLDIKSDQGREAETQLTEKGLKAKFFHTDVTDWETQHASFKAARAWFDNSRIDIVIASAGVASPNIKHAWLPREDEPMPPEPSKPEMPAITVNLLGAYHTTHLALSYFTRQQPSTWRPQLLLISSVAGYFAQDFNPDYCGSKHGVRGLWKGIRHNGGHFGDFQANLLAPTFISTPMVEPFEDMLVWRGARIGRVGDVVDAGLRCVCDGRVEGRSVCVVRGTEREGDGNFDVRDDADGEGFCGGLRMVEALEGDVFGGMWGNAR